MRLSLSLCALAWVVLPVYSQQPAPAPTAPVTPPVGQGVNGDWAYVERYRAANQPLIANSAPKRVVFMGDSITEGWALQPFIKDNRNFVGRGISGQTAPQMLVRFRSDVIALKPAIVHIMAGTNDVAQNTGPETPQETEGYIKSMVELALANKIKVVLASIRRRRNFIGTRDWIPLPRFAPSTVGSGNMPRVAELRISIIGRCWPRPMAP